MIHIAPRSKKSFLAVAGLFGATLVTSMTGVIYAQSSGAIAQGFQTAANASNIVAGALVSTQANTPGAIELATIYSANRLVGVIDKNPLVALSGNTKEAEVVLSGTTMVLVSDINGNIHAGDKITASPIEGVGMLATTDGQIVGTAQSDFNLKKSTSRTIIDHNQKPHTTHISQIPLQVNVAFYQAPGSNFLPPFIQSLANSIAGRPVSLIRILTCSVLLLIALTSIAALIYTSVRSAITSIGRNPLAADAIRKGLIQVGIVVVLVLVFSLVASYLVLAV